MDRFLDAYAQWPAHNQMLFAIAGVVICSVLLFLACWWTVCLVHDAIYFIAVCFRGWPAEERGRPPAVAGGAAVKLSAGRRGARLRLRRPNEEGDDDAGPASE